MPKPDLKGIIAKSVELRKQQEFDTAFKILDQALLQAKEEDRGADINLLSGHAAVLAEMAGDLRRACRYHELRLPYVEDYPFALFNLAKLFRRAGDADAADRYAAEAYTASLRAIEKELIAAIIREWPEVDSSRSSGRSC